MQTVPCSSCTSIKLGEKELEVVHEEGAAGKVKDSSAKSNRKTYKKKPRQVVVEAGSPSSTM